MKIILTLFLWITLITFLVVVVSQPTPNTACIEVTKESLTSARTLCDNKENRGQISVFTPDGNRISVPCSVIQTK